MDKISGNYYKIEFHVHTCFSKDSLLKKRLLAFMCKLKGINCIAITDHNSIDGALKYKTYLNKKNIEVIIGEEIYTKDGEIIGLFLNEKIEPYLSCDETINLIKKQGGIVYVPHPYEPFRYKTVLKEEYINEYQKQIDLIEVHNGRNRNKDISNSQQKIAEKYNIRKVIGSDAHTFFEIGRNYMMLSDISKTKLLEAIDLCDSYKESKCILFAHTWTKVAKVINLVKKGQFHELYRIINRRCKRKM